MDQRNGTVVYSDDALTYGSERSGTLPMVRSPPNPVPDLSREKARAKIDGAKSCARIVLTGEEYVLRAEIHYDQQEYPTRGAAK